MATVSGVFHALAAFAVRTALLPLLMALAVGAVSYKLYGLHDPYLIGHGNDVWF
jgi:hypothetical protein